MKTNRIAFYLFFYFFANKITFGQDFPVKKYSTQDGLVQMQVLSFLKDSRGYIWCGTNFGLSKFNGETFTNYNKSKGLKYLQIDRIKEDHSGNIWLKAGNKALIKFDGAHFTHYDFPFINVRNSEFCITANNDLMVSINNKLYNFKNNKFTLINTKSILNGDEIGRVFNFKNKIIVSQNGKLYDIAHSAEIKINGNQKIYQHSFSDELLFQEADLDNGKLVFGFWDGNQYKKFYENSEKGIKVYNPSKHDFIIPANGNIYYLKKNTTQPELVAKNIVCTNSWAFLDQGDSENFWYPTEQGLLKITRKGFKQFSQDIVPYCWGVVEDTKNNFYFLNFRHSVQYFDGKNITNIQKNKFQHYDKSGTSEDWYYKPIKDKFGQIWLPNNAGVYKKSGENWTLQNLNLFNPIAFTLAEDKLNSKIVVASHKRLYTLDCKDPKMGAEILDKHPMFERLIMSLVVSSKSEYWFGGKNIGCYNASTKTFKYYTTENAKMPAKGVICLYFDWQNTLWASTFSDGIFRYNVAKDKFEPILKNHFTEGVNLIEQIDKEHLMFGTLRGLFVVNLKTIDSEHPDIKVFNQHNGYLGTEPGQLGSFRDSKGKIWITSGTILSVMDPKELDFSKTKLHINITQINDKLLPFNTKNTIFDLPKNENTATFTVESVGENRPEKSQYSFRIKGVLNNWTPWQEQNILMVNNLPNGKYTLEVRSKSGNLDSGFSEANSLVFKVEIPFYKSPQFYKFSFLIGLLLLGLIIYFWLKQIIDKQKLIEQKVILDEQENKVKFLQVATIQAQMNPHFTFNVLGTLQHLILNNETEKANENLMKLSSLIRNYLESSLLGDEQNGSLFKHEISLDKEIELLKMYIEFEQLQYHDKFEYKIEIDQNLNLVNYKIPPLILQPFVENAIKHGLLYLENNIKGELIIKFFQENEETLICYIIDNGVGIQKAKFIQSQSIRKYKSRGTELVNKRVKILNEMGYNIAIYTTENVGGGTKVKISIGYN